VVRSDEDAIHSLVVHHRTVHWSHSRHHNHMDLTIFLHDSFRTFICSSETKGNDKVDFECKTKTENETTEFEDKIEFKLSIDDEGLKVKVEYEEETELKRRRRRLGSVIGNRRQLQTIEEQEIEISYEVVFDKIIEYRKPATVGGRRHLTAVKEAYDWETDEIVSEIAFGSWTGFSDVRVNQRRRRRRLQDDGNVTVEEDGAEDDTVYTFSLTSADGVATFDFTIAQTGDETASATANKMQIDIRMTDYPYVETGTNIALLSTVESEREVDIEYADEEDEESADNRGPDDEEDDEEGDEEDRVSDEDDEDEDSAGNEEDQVEDEDEDDSRRRRRRRRRLSVRESSEVKIAFDDAVAATGIRPFGEFTWARDATVTTITPTDTTNTAITQGEPVVPVMTTTGGNETQTESATIQVVATSDGNNRLAFSFVGGAIAKNAPDIYWDPETGVNYAEVGSSAGRMVWGGGMALVAAMTMLVW